ncbi:MAG: hypothetical protein AAFW69_04855 [Pseudomonadota bacterium]
MQKGELAEDPRGLIQEAYRIEGIHPASCRSIFFDWSLGREAEGDPRAAIRRLLDHYGTRHPDHPMTAVLTEGLAAAAAPRRTGRAAARRAAREG